MTSLDPGSYTVRQSSRARRVSLRVSPDGALEVVVPLGFDQSLIPVIVQQKRRWIARATRRMQERQRLLEAQPRLPQRISLPAIGEEWRVTYRATPSARVTVTERDSHRLTLSGHVADAALCRAALRRWLARKARKHLVPWLTELSRESGLSFRKVTVRGQRTRWGSCSSRGTISINRKLLFLPPPLVGYVLVHELSHTRHLNHSPQFWAMVRKMEPACQRLRAELREAWRHVPRWAQS